MENKYSYGGGQNTRKINPLFKDIKEYNKYLLSLIGIFVLLLTGIISYNYTNTSYAKWSSSVESKNILKLSVKTEKDALAFAKDNVGIGGLEEITHEIDSTLQVDERFRTEYRYRGGDSVVNNYVTFNNELWRIIGIIPTEDTNGNVENRFKIIRNNSLGEYFWNNCTTSDYEKCDDSGKKFNDWTGATLNTYLNNNYYNTLSTDAKNMIGTTKYYLGGYINIYANTNEMWQYERKNESNRTGYYYDTNPVMQNDASKKIAIMYVSDYGYAASKECSGSLSGYDTSINCKTPNNWLDKSQVTWMLSPCAGGNGVVFHLGSTGGIGNGGDVRERELAILPVLTLFSNVRISSGIGTYENPYQLSI